MNEENVVRYKVVDPGGVLMKLVEEEWVVCRRDDPADRLAFEHVTDTTRIPSDPPTLPSAASNPSDTHDPPSVGTVEDMSPQSEQVDRQEGGPVPRAGPVWLEAGDEIRPINWPKADKGEAGSPAWVMMMCVDSACRRSGTEIGMPIGLVAESQHGGQAFRCVVCGGLLVPLTPYTLTEGNDRAQP